MEYENTEIYYFYQVYPDNSDFTGNKTNIKWQKEDNNPELYLVYPDNGDFTGNKTDIKWQKEENNPELYLVYPDNPDFMIDKKDICFAGNYGKNTKRKYRMFLETEYLEELYEEITIFISANKAITIEAMFPKGCQNQPNKFTCVIPVNYPLVFPFFYMNDVLYMNRIYCCHLERVKIIVAKYTMDYRKYMNCISCACVLKNENWKSDTMFSDIFSEWDRIRILKRIVGYELALEDLMIYRDLEYCNIIHIMEYLYA